MKNALKKRAMSGLSCTDLKWSAEKRLSSSDYVLLAYISIEPVLLGDSVFNLGATTKSYCRLIILVSCHLWRIPLVLNGLPMSSWDRLSDEAFSDLVFLKNDYESSGLISKFRSFLPKT